MVLRNIGLRVKELRRALGLTQAAVARELGTSVQRVQYIEAGKANLRMTTLIALANVLAAPIESLLAAPTTRPAAVTRARPTVRSVNRRTGQTAEQRPRRRKAKREGRE